MILTIDAGNSRTKWGLHNGTGWEKTGSCFNRDLPSLAQTWESLPMPDRIIISNVAGQGIRARLLSTLSAAGWPIEPIWATPQARQCDVINGYRTPTQLGSDRWAALIAARHLTPAPCVVVCAGTATTVDALSEEGRFLGGLIMPGLMLMRRSLVENTAALDKTEGTHAHFPANTADAIHSGSLAALAGAIETMRNRLESLSQTTVEVIISGGDASALLPLLPPSTRHVENLVQEGLIWIARS